MFAIINGHTPIHSAARLVRRGWSLVLAGAAGSNPADAPSRACTVPGVGAGSRCASSSSRKQEGVVL